MLLVEAFDHALLIWWRRWEDQRDIPRDEKLGELGTDLGLKKIHTFIIISCTKDIHSNISNLEPFSHFNFGTSKQP